MQTVSYPEEIKTKRDVSPLSHQTMKSVRKFSTKKSSSSAKMETLRRKTIRQDKYRPLS